MNIASIDIGTNTILLLIANINTIDGKIKPLQNEYRMPRIGRGLLPGQPISEDRVEAMMQVLDEYSSMIKSHNCSRIIANATSALRLASNSGSIRAEVKSKFGIDISVISGHEEARLSYLGAVSGIEAGKYVVIDIGGGSTEIIYGSRNNIEFSKSFLGGAVNLTEQVIRHDPPSASEIQALKKVISERFTELNGKFPAGFTAIAVAGTPTSLSCVKQNLQVYDEDKVENSILTLEDIKEITDRFSKLTSKEIIELYPDIMKGREDIILCGSLILEMVMELLQTDKITVSARGIRYGAVLDFLIKGSGSE